MKGAGAAGPDATAAGGTAPAEMLPGATAGSGAESALTAEAGLARPFSSTGDVSAETSGGSGPLGCGVPPGSTVSPRAGRIAGTLLGVDRAGGRASAVRMSWKSCWSSGPGSTPSWSAMASRAFPYVFSASARRPAPSRARMSRSHEPSRRGSSATNLRSSGITSACLPQATSAPIRSSRAAVRCSPRRSDSASTRADEGTSASAVPRHRARADVRSWAARSGSATESACLPSLTRVENSWVSRSPGSRRS